MGNGSESIGSFSQRLVLIRLELHDLPFVEIASRRRALARMPMDTQAIKACTIETPRLLAALHLVEYPNHVQQTLWFLPSPT